MSRTKLCGVTTLSNSYDVHEREVRLTSGENSIFVTLLGMGVYRFLE